MTRYQVKRTYLWAALVVLDLNAFPNDGITLWVFRKLLWTARTKLDCTIIFLVFLMMKVSSTTRTVFFLVIFWTVFEEEFVWWSNGLGFLFWTRIDLVLKMNQGYTEYYFSAQQNSLFSLEIMLSLQKIQPLCLMRQSFL